VTYVLAAFALAGATASELVSLFRDAFSRRNAPAQAD
jgi:hypothetical protein